MAAPWRRAISLIKIIKMQNAYYQGHIYVVVYSFSYILFAYKYAHIIKKKTQKNQTRSKNCQHAIWYICKENFQFWANIFDCVLSSSSTIFIMYIYDVILSALVACGQTRFTAYRETEKMKKKTEKYKSFELLFTCGCVAYIQTYGFGASIVEFGLFDVFLLIVFFFLKIVGRRSVTRGTTSGRIPIEYFGKFVLVGSLPPNIDGKLYFPGPGPKFNTSFTLKNKNRLN